MAPETEAQETDEPTDDDEVAVTLRDVRAFLDDPVALIERALELVRRRDGLETP